MTRTFNPLTFASCLLAISEYVHASFSLWEGSTEDQGTALGLLPAQADIGKFPELERWVDQDAEPLNKILQERGFSSRFDPIPPGRFGALSILDLLVEWLEEGFRVAIENGDTTYPGFRLEGEGSGVTAVRGKGLGGVAARIETKSGDVLWIHQGGPEPENDFEAALLAETLLGALSRSGTRREANLIAPCVSLHESRQLDWAVGLEIPGKAVVQSGFQETRFRMNHRGARAQVATGMVLERSLPETREEIIVKGPFLLVIERPGVETPVFSAYIGPESFIDPDDLD
jgi:hypothetical protein